MAEAGGPSDEQFRPSKGVAAGNWLMSAVTGLLSSRTSRRGFLVRSALAGSAFTVAGCSFGTKKGPAYQRLTDCAPNSLCRGDGYTEFCCSINGGYNTCPPDAIPAGWWKADSSHWCHGGPRWYVDCNQKCCGPRRADGLCQGCSECRCGPTCNHRRVYCNYFRYGQCNQHHAVGPIACRLSFCEPEWIFYLGCTGPELRDNRTAGHVTGCLITGPPSPPPTTTTTRPPATTTTTRPPPSSTTTTTTSTTTTTTTTEPPEPE